MRYDPWGDLLEHGGNAPTALTQGWGVDAAYQQDGDTDLILMGSRYYDPSIGRFLSQDPAGAGDNWYEYADNDPLGEEDPTGLLPESVDGISLGLPGGPGAPGTYGDKSANYLIEGVYEVHYDKNGDRNPCEVPTFLYNIAIPLNVSLLGNLDAARNFQNEAVGFGMGSKLHVVGLLSTVMASLAIAKTARYYGSHVGHTTPGDFKYGLQQGTPLYQFADLGGNFNAGMIGEGLAMTRGLVALSGDYAIAKDSHFHTFIDDAPGAAALQDGYTYAMGLP